MPNSDADFVKVKTITSHVGYARFLTECKDVRGGWIVKPREIKTPYSSGLTVRVLAWRDHFVWVAETSHKRYEVFSVAPRLLFNTEKQAEDVAIAQWKAANGY